MLQRPPYEAQNIFGDHMTVFDYKILGALFLYKDESLNVLKSCIYRKLDLWTITNVSRYFLVTCPQYVSINVYCPGIRLVYTISYLLIKFINVLFANVDRYVSS